MYISYLTNHNLTCHFTQWDNNPRELRPESGLLKMRKEMGLFANLRPAKVLPQLLDASTLKKEVVEGVDVMVVRELTGDVYFGTPKGIDTVDGERVGYNDMIYSESEIDGIARVAGMYSFIVACAYSCCMAISPACLQVTWRVHEEANCTLLEGPTY